MKNVRSAGLDNNIFSIYAYGKSLEGSENDMGECKGLARLISSCGFVQEYKENQEHSNVKAAKLVLEGCECYRLFESKNNRGKYQVSQFFSQKIWLLSLALVQFKAQAL